MPTGWVPPEKYLEHGTVTIYHVYKDDDFDQGPREYWYGWDEGCCEGSDDFDVRDLPNPKEHDVNTDEGRKAILREAIDAGILTQNGILHSDSPDARGPLGQIYDILYLDMGPKGEFYNPHKACDADTLSAIADVVRPLFAEGEGCRANLPPFKQKYFESHCGVCPFCESKDITSGPVEADSMVGWAEVECTRCGYTWQDVWRVIDITEFRDKEGHEIPEPGSSAPT